MTAPGGRPGVRTVHADDIPPTSIGEPGAQQLLLGEARGDGSPMLMGITTVRPGQTTSLIEHDTAEVGYVLSGAGWLVTDTDERRLVSGDAVLIEPRCWHALRAGGQPLQMLYVFPTPAVPPTRTRGRGAS